MSINEVFASIDPSVPSVTICSRSDGKTVTIMAYKPADQEWQNCQDPQPNGSNQEFYAAIDTNSFSMTTYPVVIAGYSYQTYVNLNADEPLSMSAGEIIRNLKITADAHDRTFYVAPDTNMMALLSHIPVECDSATIIMRIEFKERRYTVLSWRCAGDAGYEGCVVDPPAFESTLKLSGWRQIDPPSHQDGKKYHVMIARNNDGVRYVLSDRTDLQAYQKRENSLISHFVFQHA